MTVSANPIFCALDTADLDRALTLAAALGGKIGGIKLGKEFFTAHGPEGARKVAAAGGLPLFLDLKLHDIPNTVAGAVSAALRLRPAILTVHATGGPAMLRAAAEAASNAGEARPLIVAVTILTSLDEEDLAAVGLRGPISERAVALATLARAAGLDGAVCSPREIGAIREACGPDFKLVVPGIRPAGSEAGDQKRVLTPADALAAGADYLVVGRPITAAPDPAAAARALAAELTEVPR